MSTQYYCIVDFFDSEIKDGFVEESKEVLEERMLNHLADVTIDDEDPFKKEDWEGASNTRILEWYGYEVAIKDYEDVKEYM